MIDDENHPEMIRAHQELLRRLGTTLGDGRNLLTRPLLDTMFDTIKNHRLECRTRGIDFPVLVALVVPRLGIVEFKRADLDIASLRVLIVNFVRNNPQAKMDEVVQAFRMAYPDLKPDEILIGHTAAGGADVRQKERAERHMREAEQIIANGGIKDE